MPAKKRPASASASASASALQREVARLRKENAQLRGEVPGKKPPVGPPGSAYVTALLGGREFSVSFEMDSFDETFADELYATLSESVRDGRPLELTLKGGKKVDLKKTLKQNGITPNSFVYARYTGPAPWE